MKVFNLNSIFENCSILTFVPDISKWKLNNKIKINNIFKGCTSLLIIPDIYKWNINIPPECFIITSSNSNSIDIKEYSSNLSEDLPSMKDNDNTNSIKITNSKDFSNNNEDLNDYMIIFIINLIKLIIYYLILLNIFEIYSGNLVLI